MTTRSLSLTVLSARRGSSAEGCGTEFPKSRGLTAFSPQDRQPWCGAAPGAKKKMRGQVCTCAVVPRARRLWLTPQPEPRGEANGSGHTWAPLAFSTYCVLVLAG